MHRHGPDTRVLVTVLVLASTVVRAQVPDGSATNNPAAVGGPASAYSSIPEVILPRDVVLDGPPAPIPPATISRDGQHRVTVRAIRLAEPMKLDGRLDEEVYRTVPPITGFFQMEPSEGQPATEQTDVWVLFDRDNVYVTARCWDRAPQSQWVANEMRRNTNQLRQNDTFGVMFDTFYDRRNGYFFYTNPLGARADRYYTDETDSNADALPVWDVRPGRFEGGWVVEIQIPFKTLRYQEGAAQVWGIQLRRAIRRRNEWAYLSPVPLAAARQGSSGIFRISLAGTLVGLEAPPARKNLDIKPYGITSATTDLTATPPLSNQGKANGGLDVRYGITPNMTADFTLNTDFAQVEVDEQQVNLTRFPLVFPEKREFFQEGRGIFDFGGTVGGPRLGPSGGSTPSIFFSRRIGLEGSRPVPILGGARLTGEVGKFSVGALNLQTRESDAAGAASTNFTVMRVKRDILRRSRIGAIATNRSIASIGDGANQAYGADAAFSFYDNVNLSGYFARTHTAELRGRDTSYQSRFSYDGDRYGAQVEHLFVGDNFNPEVGFLSREDFRRTFGSARFSPRPKKIDAVRQFIWEGNFNHIENTSGQLETRVAEARFSTEFNSSDVFTANVARDYELLVRPFRIATGMSIPAGAYEFTNTTLTYAVGGQRRANGTLSFARGSFYNGDITSFGFTSGRVELLKQFSLEPSLSFNAIDLPQGSFVTKLIRARANYSFTPWMFVSGLFQYNSSNDSLSMNLRLRWEYFRGSELFVVYTDDRDTFGARFAALKNRALVVKINRLLRF